MAKKIVASAESLSALDLLIAEKKDRKEDFTVVQRYWIIIIIVEGIGTYTRPIVDYPPVTMLDEYIKTATSLLKEAPVEELVKLREIMEVKK